MSVCILDNRILRSFEKTPKLHIYKEFRDLDEHFEDVDNSLDYYDSQWVMKCDLFALTLIEAIMTWFKTFLMES